MSERNNSSDNINRGKSRRVKLPSNWNGADRVGVGRDKDEIGESANTGSFTDTSPDESRLFTEARGNRESIDGSDNDSGETNNANGDGSSVGGRRTGQHAEQQQNTSSTARQTTRSRKSGKQQKHTQAHGDSIEPEPDIVGDFDPVSKLKDVVLTIEDLTKLTYAGFGGLANLAGEHWRVTQAEAKELAQAIKKLPVTKDSRLFKLIARNAPYLNFALVAGAILGPRVVISYYTYKAQQEVRLHEQQQQQKNQTRRTDSNAASPNNSESTEYGAYPTGYEQAYNIIN